MSSNLNLHNGSEVSENTTNGNVNGNVNGADSKGTTTTGALTISTSTASTNTTSPVSSTEPTSAIAPSPSSADSYNFSPAPATPPATSASSTSAASSSSSVPATSSNTLAANRSARLAGSSSSASSTLSSSSSSTSSSSTSPPVSSTHLTRTPSAAKTSTARLQRDLIEVENEAPEGVSASPIDSSNLYLWRACIFGSEDTEWEGGIFQLHLHFPTDYPQKPPTVKFLSRLFHPNIFTDGTLCLDIIQDKWSPVNTVCTLLIAIQSLLGDPNVSSPANPEAAKLYVTDKKAYRKRVREAVAKCSGM